MWEARSVDVNAVMELKNMYAETTIANGPETKKCCDRAFLKMHINMKSMPCIR